MGEDTATEPQIRRQRIIERPRLTRLLDEAQGRIKLLVAPAGYGKTTLAREWLAERSGAWYTLTAASADVAALATSLYASAAPIVSATPTGALQRLLSVTSRPDEDVDLLAEVLAQELATWPADSWLVLDDYHAIAGTRPAERLVEALLLAAPVNALILTRRRPAWVSSRRVLYGEVSELDRADLAMTPEEARRLLFNRPDTAALIKLAQGWPAVISLASTSGVAAPDLLAAPHLYSFFAQEIYRRLDRHARRTLCELALHGPDGQQLVLQEIRPDEAERITRIGVDRGFLNEEGNRVEMHPLLRSFLQRKLTEESGGMAASLVEPSVQKLTAHQLWDEAFAMIDQFRCHHLLPGLIAAAQSSLLAAGRLVTLRRWLENAPQTSPIVRLLSAELSFREGRFHESAALAELAARGSREDSDWEARANIAAGRAAHAAFREEAALKFYRRARLISVDAEMRRVAAFGELAAAIELQLQDEALGLLESLQPAEDLSPPERVILTDRKINLQTHFGLPVAFDEGLAALQLVHLVPDPVARCSFRNVFGWSLAAGGYYEEALEVTREQFDDAQRCRLDFVAPYALIIEALARNGMHEYVTAEEALNDADERIAAIRDRTGSLISWAVRTRLYNAQAAFDLALRPTLQADADLPKSIHAELCGSYAVSKAAVGDATSALEFATTAVRLSTGAEASIGAASARAIVSLRRGDHERGLECAQAALTKALHTGLIEPFTSTYRGCPELVVSLLQDAAAHAPLARVLSIARDLSMISQVKGAGDHSVASLSTREKQVLSLVAQGMSNIDIGKALFISPVTVKVHVRHIFEKLGVRSRAEAAMRASQLNR